MAMKRTVVNLGLAVKEPPQSFLAPIVQHRVDVFDNRQHGPLGLDLSRSGERELRPGPSVTSNTRPSSFLEHVIGNLVDYARRLQPAGTHEQEAMFVQNPRFRKSSLASQKRRASLSSSLTSSGNRVNSFTLRLDFLQANPAIVTHVTHRYVPEGNFAPDE